MEAALELGSIVDVESVIDSYKPKLQKKYRLELQSEMIMLEEQFKEDRRRRQQNKSVYGSSQKIEQSKRIIHLLPLVDDTELIKRSSRLVLGASKFYATT